MSSVRNQFIENLKTSKEYRDAFVEEVVQTGIASQIRALREKLDMNQTDFGKLFGKSQSWVARLEDPDEATPTLSTLLEVAHGNDTALVVRLASFSELVDWMSGTPHLLPGFSPQSIAVPDFEHDSGLQRGYSHRRKLRRGV